MIANDNDRVRSAEVQLRIIVVDAMRRALKAVGGLTDAELRELEVDTHAAIAEIGGPGLAELDFTAGAIDVEIRARQRQEAS